jgi:hypothetical protein
MAKTKYAILTTAALLPLIALAPFLLQIVNAQTDNSDNGDNSGSFADRHPTFCTLGPYAASAIGHPLIGVLIGGICTLP